MRFSSGVSLRISGARVQHHLLRQRAGQLFQLRIALFLTVLTEPRGALHQRDEQGETDQNNDRHDAAGISVLREPYSTFENLQLNVARSAGYKVASCVIFLA